MTKLELTKQIANIVVGLGTGAIVRTTIKNNVATDTIPQKIAVTSASVVIAMMASEATGTYTDNKIDELAAWWNEHVTVR